MKETMSKIVAPQPVLTFKFCIAQYQHKDHIVYYFVFKHYFFYMQCDRTLALDAFLKNVSVGGDKIAIFGCGCSIATEAVAEISSYWNITHVRNIYACMCSFFFVWHKN